MLRSFLLKFVVIAISATFTHTAIANGTGGNVTIQAVSVQSANLATITSLAALPNPDNCQNVTMYMVIDSEPAFSQKMSLIVTAAASGRQVNIYLTGCTTTPWGFTSPVVGPVELIIQ